MNSFKILQIPTAVLIFVFSLDTFGVASLKEQGNSTADGVIYWKVRPQASRQAQTWQQHAAVVSVVFSPDGKYVLTGSTDQTAVLRDWNTGKIVHTWQHKDTVYGVAFSPDAQYVLTGSDDKTATLREVQTGKTVQTWEHNDWVRVVAFTIDGGSIFIGSADGTAVLRELQSGKTIQTWRHGRKILSAAFSPDGRFVLTGSDDNTAILREVQTGKVIHTWRHDGSVQSTAFSPDSRYVITGSWDKTAVLRDVQTGTAIRVWRQNDAVYGVAFSPDGKYVLTGSTGNSAVLRELETGKTVQVWHHNDAVYGVAFSPNGRYVLTGSWDKTVALHPTGPSVRYPLQEAIQAELKDAEKKYRSLPKLLADHRSTLEKTRPVKDEFESTAQFNTRVTRWNQAIEKLNDDIKSHFASLGSLPLDRKAVAFSEAIGKSYGDPELLDVRYDAETARFFATLKASHDHDFKRTITVAVPNEQARVAKQQLESAEHGLVVEFRVTENNELIWGVPKLLVNGKIYLAQYTDKDFVPPSTQQAANSVRLRNIEAPSIPTFSNGPIPKISDDPNLVKLQTEVLNKEREQKEAAARQAEEKRLKERLSELNRLTGAGFEDDLPSLLAKASRLKLKPNSSVHVLAIGINDYADVPDVPFADRSAKQFAEMAQVLLGAQKENVIVLTDAEATSGRLRGRLRTLLNRLGPEDQLLFYYAGHGVPSKDGGSTYLLAQDGGPGSYEEPDLKLSQIYTAIARSKVGKAKMFIDACFSGRSDKDAIVFEGVAPLVVKQNQTIPDSQRLAILTAGRGDQFSNQDKATGHRLFSYHLMRLLMEDGLKLEIAQVHKRLRERVLNASRRIGPEFEQEPEFFGNGQLTFSN